MRRRPRASPPGRRLRAMRVPRRTSADCPGRRLAPTRPGRPGCDSLPAMRTFLRGLTAAIPIASGYIPVAITFGLIVRSFGLSPSMRRWRRSSSSPERRNSSQSGCTGAALVPRESPDQRGRRLLQLDPLAAGGGLLLGAVAGTPILLLVQIVIAGWLLNLRHLLMSSVIAHNISGSAGVGLRSVLAFGVTDEVFGVAGWRIAEGGAVQPPFLLGLEIGAYSAWVGGTIIGALAGEVLPFHPARCDGTRPLRPLRPRSSPDRSAPPTAGRTRT
jgi:hypothetical protein